MGRHFSPKSFLRLLSKALLKQFFDERGLLSHISWALLKETEVGQIFDSWQALPDGQREEVERAFHAVHEMACEAGVRALVEEGQFHGLDLAVPLERHTSLYDKAMWAYLQHRQVFLVASLFNSADALPGRSWHRQAGLPCKPPDTSDGATRAMAAQLSEFYRETQARGHRCTVETYLRGGRQHYFFAYPDDYADLYIGHDDQGQFVKRPEKRAFEIVFVYDPQAGTLDLYATGDRGVKARLLYIFCDTILGENPPAEQPGSHPFELNGLRSRDFSFATEPGDGIEEVCIRKMRLSVGNARRRIALEVDPQGGPREIYDMMAECLREDWLSNNPVNVTHAEFQFRFAQRGPERPRPITFSISFPNASNLKSLSEERRLLVEKYLKRWGIARG